MERWSSHSRPRQICDRVFSFRYRNRDSLRQTTHHFRSLPTGGWHHQPQVRWHGTGTFHQPSASTASGRRNPIAEHARGGQHLHTLPSPGVFHSPSPASHRSPIVHSTLL